MMKMPLVLLVAALSTVVLRVDAAADCKNYMAKSVKVDLKALGGSVVCVSNDDKFKSTTCYNYKISVISDNPFVATETFSDGKTTTTNQVNVTTSADKSVTYMRGDPQKPGSARPWGMQIASGGNCVVYYRCCGKQNKINSLIGFCPGKDTQACKDALVKKIKEMEDAAGLTKAASVVCSK